MSNTPFNPDEVFDQLAREAESTPSSVKAPSRLKARVYSALIRRQEKSGPLLALPDTQRAGHKLCVFESFWQQLPLGQEAKQFNCCSLCHARVLGERMGRAPIYWGHCPYVAFGKK
jgi:hypothetical protein